jgi:hypothetical protein
VSCRVVSCRFVSFRVVAYLVLSLQEPTMWDGRGAIGAGAGFARPETHAMYDLPSAIGKQVVIVLCCDRLSLSSCHAIALSFTSVPISYLGLRTWKGTNSVHVAFLTHHISMYSPTPEGRINRPSRLDPRARGPKAQQVKRLVLGPMKCGRP